jgi:hypothetical protein
VGDVSFQNQAVAAAYGGMRYRTETPVPDTIGLTPEKITLFDEQLPLFGDPLYVTFDAINDEVLIEDEQGGIYEVTFFVDFIGEQGEEYTFAIYLDGAPIGNDVVARVSQADPEESLQLDTIARINGGGSWSVWVNADKAATTFNVRGVSLYFKRISVRLDDA